MNLIDYVYQTKRITKKPKEVKLSKPLTEGGGGWREVGYIRYKNALRFSAAVLSIA